MNNLNSHRKAKSKVRMMLFYGKYARGKVPLKQLQVKLQKTKEVTYLEDNKPETSFRLTYLKAERKKRELRLMF